MALELKKVDWDLSPLFKGDSDSEIEKGRKLVEEKVRGFVKKWKNNDDFVKKPEALKEALEDYDKILERYGASGKEGYYFWLRMQQDQNNPEIKGKYQKMVDFSLQLENELQFFMLKISKMPESEQAKFLESKELEEYKHFLKRAFDEGKHLLSEEEEKIMNLKAENAYVKWVRMTSGFLAKEEREVFNDEGKKEKKLFEEIRNLLDNQKKEVRDKAAEAFNEILAKHADSAEAEINAILADKKVNDELRKFKRADSARHLSDDIESEVVDAMLDSVSKRFEIAKRYYELKARLFGVKKLAYHERNVPYGKIDKKYSYDEGSSLVYDVLNKLDNEFGEIFADFARSEMIDVYPKKGKTGGAFCAHWLKSQPTYIMLNYAERLQDVLTLAHELGHGINNEMIKRKQRAIYFETPLATAEVASTFMEDFVLEKLENEADDELKLALMMNKLNSDVSTIFRQVACYRFEQDLHSAFTDKGYLSKEEIGEIFRRSMEAYMGNAVEHPSGSENCWVYWSHIRAFFYVYSYALGLLISKAMQREVRKDRAFMEKVKEFLSSGASNSPKNIFSNLGIDITRKEFWEKGLDEIEEMLKETEYLAKKLGKV